MTYLLGIDVGTTRTAAAICRPGTREAEIVNLGDRSSAVPSVLFLGTDGTVLVGDAAERRAVTDPDRVVREFKRRLGDPTPLNVAGRAWPAQELAARLVRWVVDRVAEREGGPATRIAVTHPASWGTHKKDLLGAALAGQGLKVVFLAEPQAAALHYAAAERVEPGSTIAVYDLGGGTFDAAVVHKDTSAGFALVGRPEGLEHLGGIDFDQAVFDHVRAGMPGAFDTLDDSDAAVLAAVARVRRDCTEAKEALSADTEVSIPVLLPESRGAVRLHRSEFEQMIRPQVEDTVAALRRAIGSAGFTPEQLSAVLLVGGSSRVPLVSQLVSEELGRPVAVDADPKNAIAKGAALALTPNAGATGGTPAHTPAIDPGKTRPVATGFGAAGVGAAGIGAGAIGAAGVGPVANVANLAGPGGPPGAHGTGAGAAVPPAALAPGTGGWSEVPVAHAGPVTPPPRPYQPALSPHSAPPPAPAPRGSSPAALITIGGLFAAAIVVAALLLLPDHSPSNTGDQSPIGTNAPVSTIPPVVAPPLEETTTPAPAPTRTARPAPPRTTPPPVVPPPVTTTTTPPPTSTTTTTPPTSEPTTPPEPTDPTEPPCCDPPEGGGSSSAAAPPVPPASTSTLTPSGAGVGTAL